MSQTLPDPSFPRRVRAYRNHHLDRTHWDRFQPRDGEVLILTSYKTGTTWMQRIVSLLVRDCRRSRTTRVSFPWERDGWPWWSHHYHAASFWPYRHLPNLLAVHYNDLLADLAGQMRRVAQFLGIAVAGEEWPTLVAAARFDAMREEAIREEAVGDRANRDLKGGAATFFFQGTNGRCTEIGIRQRYRSAPFRSSSP